MKFVDLFNFSGSEEVKFNFPCTIGGIFFGYDWKFGINWFKMTRLIITNERLIIISRPFKDTLKRPINIIIRLEEIREVIKEKKTIRIRYKTYPDQFDHYDVITLKIGFLKHDTHDYKVKDRLNLINEIYDFLTNTETFESHIICPICGIKIPKNGDNCPKCGRLFNQCGICKFYIYDLGEEIQCPSCQNYFHSREFYEWLKIKGNCPNCNTKTYRNNQHPVKISD
ncbi:MAG: hypothetical protein HWN65_13245 [Candidatus Helarchaeota archaeon]|nr:hypothetical protein [Candidatus Helarchaeota archaeon]